MQLTWLPLYVDSLNYKTPHRSVWVVLRAEAFGFLGETVTDATRLVQCVPKRDRKRTENGRQMGVQNE